MSQIRTDKSIYVFNSIFKHLSPNGAILVTNLSPILVISETLFSSTYSTEDGGSIYIQGDTCIQYRVCSVNSTISDDIKFGSHSWTEVMRKNYIIESSISNCKGYDDSAFLNYGYQLIDSTNISHAKCFRDAALYWSEPSSHRMNFTSIFNNTANKTIVDHHEGHYNVDHCNIVRNVYTDDANDEGIIMCAGPRLFKYNLCVFASNTGKKMFLNEYGSRLIVDQCYFVNNHGNPITSTESMMINKTDKFVLSLHHLSTQECVDFPLMNIIFQQKDKTTNPYHMESSIISLSFYDSFYE